jgi:hypothetical protein
MAAEGELQVAIAPAAGGRSQVHQLKVQGAAGLGSRRLLTMQPRRGSIRRRAKPRRPRPAPATGQSYVPCQNQAETTCIAHRRRD